MWYFVLHADIICPTDELFTSSIDSALGMDLLSAQKFQTKKLLIDFQQQDSNEYIDFF